MLTVNISAKSATSNTWSKNVYRLANSVENAKALIILKGCNKYSKKVNECEESATIGSVFINGVNTVWKQIKIRFSKKDGTNFQSKRREFKMR